MYIFKNSKNIFKIFENLKMFLVFKILNKIREILEKFRKTYR